ncbi:GGDEF domain-containing protein [Devosia sp. UYZn731]
MMGTLKDWLAGLTGGPNDRADRRQNERPAPIAIQPGDLDPLTGALRGERFMAMMAAEQALQPGALLLIDMTDRADGLTSGNPDTSDEALMLLAQAIRQAVRYDDLVGHVEGYRFAVLLRGAPQPLADAIAQRICDSVDDTVFLTHEGITQLEVAVGGAVFKQGNGRDLYTDAQKALDAARHADGQRFWIVERK